MRIRSDSHDLSLPMRECVLSELKLVNNQEFAQFIAKDAVSLTDMWLRMVQVSDALGEVLQLHNRVKGPCPSIAEVNQLSRRLDALKLSHSFSGYNDELRAHGLQTELLY